MLGGENTAETSHVNTRLALGAIVAVVVLVGGCTAAAWVHDKTVELSQAEFREMVEKGLSVGATDGEVSLFLEELESENRIDDARMWHYPAEIVKQHDCLPRPCSLVDEGVEPGSYSITLRIENPEGWLPSVCSSDFIANFILDETGRYTQLLISDASACL
ncbi:MAG: hypothetical protein HY873_07010 [Chloroflexi bacterium]|nr:hypothetical protein [Chloroflexota bacterium]